MTPRYRHLNEVDEEELNKDRMAHIGSLTTGLIHEIRKPLNNISLNIGLLKKDVEKTNKLDRIESSLKDLTVLLDNLSTFARPPRINPVPININEFLADTLEFYKPSLNADKIELIEDYSRDMFPVYIDKPQITQVLVNLLDNARYVAGECGLITIKTEQTKNATEIRISDNGGGVPPEEEVKIFEAFFSTKSNSSGLGLGISRRIVEGHGGRLILENTFEKGACFCIRLPRSINLEWAQKEEENNS